MVDILINTLLQICIFIVAVYAVGYIISLINRLFYKSINGNRFVCYATGFIGTPIHELSHAFMCLVFLHKINEIKLFQTDESGVLGYVNHSYNRRNPYKVAGNYFIGVAPIVVGAVVLYVLMMLLLPDAYAATRSGFETLALVVRQKKYSYLLSAVFQMVWGVIKGVILGSPADWKWWVFIVLCLCISLHMNLSGADVKGSITALPIIIVFFFAINLILGFTPIYGGFLTAATSVGCTLTGFLLLSAIFALFILVIGLIVWAIRKGIAKR